MNNIKDEERSDVIALADAMNNLANALRDTNQLVRDLQITQSQDMNLLQAVTELSQRIAVLSTRIR